MVSVTMICKCSCLPMLNPETSSRARSYWFLDRFFQKRERALLPNKSLTNARGRGKGMEGRTESAPYPEYRTISPLPLKKGVLIAVGCTFKSYLLQHTVRNKSTSTIFSGGVVFLSRVPKRNTLANDIQLPGKYHSLTPTGSLGARPVIFCFPSRQSPRG